MSLNVRFSLSYDIKITLKFHSDVKNVIILSLCMQCSFGRHNISHKSINPTNGLSILLHGVISLPDATSYDESCLSTCTYDNSVPKAPGSSPHTKKTWYNYCINKLNDDKNQVT